MWSKAFAEFDAVATSNLSSVATEISTQNPDLPLSIIPLYEAWAVMHTVKLLQGTSEQSIAAVYAGCYADWTRLSPTEQEAKRQWYATNLKATTPSRKPAARAVPASVLPLRSST